MQTYVGLVTLLAACGAANSTRESAARKTASQEQPAAVDGGGAPSAAKSSAAPEPTPAAVQPAPPPSCPPASPPPAVEPPEPRTAQSGDGEWTRLGDASRGERAAQGEALLYRTVLHPHPASRFVSVTLAAIDLCRARLGFVPGVQDVPQVELGIRRGLVPETDRAAVIAVFNGGYKPEHGHFGMFAAGTTLVPAREDACTLLISKQGRIEISGHKPEPGAELIAFRQTPPCLFEQGALDARLASGNEKPWGGQAKDLVTRRRSALAVTLDARYLIYAVGEEAGPRYLAKALLAAGAAVGAELDINWYWTRFLLLSERDGRLAVGSSLISGMEYQPTSYVERASDRDFFYVMRRPSGS
ncbi:MAG TPA: hypothetical protein VGP93_19550 [Polyangiaceae bacterium]|nr:hypothetical protein [Polyangiaceae bacterium]